MLRRLTFFRRMYEWMEGWAERPSAAWALFVFAWIDNIFFPLPSEVLQLALYASRPKRSLWYATVVVLATLCGAASGYGVGWALEGVARGLVEQLEGQRALEEARGWMTENQSWATFLGSLTPASDKLIVLGSGILELPFARFVFFYTLGRAVRAVPLAVLFTFAGPRLKPCIERHVELISTIGTVLVVLAVVGAVLLS